MDPCILYCRLYVTTFYVGSLIVPSLILNRRTQDIHNAIQLDTNVLSSMSDSEECGNLMNKEKKTDNDNNDSVEEGPVTMIYACATMWHETKDEMLQLLKSLFR